MSYVLAWRHVWPVGVETIQRTNRGSSCRLQLLAMQRSNVIALTLVHPCATTGEKMQLVVLPLLRQGAN